MVWVQSSLEPPASTQALAMLSNVHPSPSQVNPDHVKWCFSHNEEGVGSGATVGAAVGTSVGADVGGEWVGAVVGVSVGATVGAEVGVEVGVTLGAEVGVEVGACVGTEVPSSHHVPPICPQYVLSTVSSVSYGTPPMTQQGNPGAHSFAVQRPHWSLPGASTIVVGASVVEPLPPLPSLIWSIALLSSRVSQSSPSQGIFSAIALNITSGSANTTK